MTTTDFQETSTEENEAADATRRLADFVANLSYESLDAEVIHKAKLLIRDGLGNQLGASTIAEPARVAHELIAEFGGAEQATITGYGEKVPLPHAAMINAMLGHGVELDDAHAAALTKSGSLLIPTIMTTGEHLSRSGQDTITAAVAGYDLMVRIGMTITPGHRQRGFHTTGTVGAIASAGASAKQFKFNTEQVADALGLGAMQSAGIQAYLDSPCMAKPLSPGKAAFNGTLAAMLVSKGFTGPKKGLESHEGFFSAYAEDIKANELFDGLGTDFKIMEIGFKPHAACRYAHGPIDAAQAIQAEHKLTSEDIEKVTVRMCALAIRQSGRNVTPNLNAAMGSTPFSIALALQGHLNGLKDYEEGFKDQRIHDIAREIELIPEPAYGLMGRQAVVEVAHKDGRVLRHEVQEPKGEPSVPMSPQELEDKFLGLASISVGDARAREISDMVMNIENVSNIADITKALKK